MTSITLPSDDAIKEEIQNLLVKVDIETMGIKSFIKLLSSNMGNVDLQSKKDYIKQVLTDAINEIHDQPEEDDDDQEQGDDDNEEEEEEEEVGYKVAARSKGGGLAQRKQISPQLAEFLGKGMQMARTDVVKELWNYIRTHDLQNPDNKREILLDAAMERVFGCKTFTMFTLNKYIGAHVEPFKPVDLTPIPKKNRASKKRKANGGRGGKLPKKRKVGTQPPYRLSEALQAVVGTDILPRPQVVSKIWTYIKENNLQNEKDKREILCDAKLKPVMGGKDKISMFQMNVHISNHLIEKVDKSEYRHVDDDDDVDESDAHEDGDSE
jgi:upstream activation factor subunit UAF30